MANPHPKTDHLKATQFRKGSKEAANAGRNGAKKSTEVRRQKKTFKAIAESILGKPLREGEVQDFDSITDIAGKNLDTMTAIVAVQVKKALDGDLPSVVFLRDTIGEKPVERVEVSSDVKEAEAAIDEQIKAWKAERGEAEGA